MSEYLKINYYFIKLEGVTALGLRIRYEAATKTPVAMN
jgi:hypothetical protein